MRQAQVPVGAFSSYTKREKEGGVRGFLKVEGRDRKDLFFFSFFFFSGSLIPSSLPREETGEAKGQGQGQGYWLATTSR